MSHESPPLNPYEGPLEPGSSGARERRSPARAGFRRAFSLLCWEGAFAMAYETWIGATYVSGLAGELGVGIGLVALITALPWIGPLGQPLGLWAFERASSVRGYTLRLAGLARSLWALPVLSAAWLGWRSHRHGIAFPARDWLLGLACVAFGSALLASSSAVAWMSWMRGIVPESFRGRFFGVRQRHVMGGLVVANLLAASWIGWKPGGYRVGYGIIGALAIVSAALSTWLLAKVPDVAARGPAAHRAPPWKRLLEPLRDVPFRRVLIFGALFNGALQLAGPFFPYFFTKELGIPMSQVAIWITLTNLGCLVAAGFWGHRIDREGPLRLLRYSALMYVFSPLPYALRSVELIRAIAPFEYLLNGVASSGYVLATTALLFRRCPEGKNAAYFSVHMAASGLAGAACTFLGGRLAVWLEPWGGFRALWIVASGARFLALWVGYRLLTADSDRIRPSGGPGGKGTRRADR